MRKRERNNEFEKLVDDRKKLMINKEVQQR